MRQLNNKGFTLLEIIIVIVIFAIGMTIAIPGIMDMGQRGQIKSEARQLKDSLAEARIEAIERNSWVTVDYSQVNNNYVMFVDDTPHNYTLDAGEVVINTTTLSASKYDVTQGGGDGIAIGLGNAVSWDAKGMPYSSGGGLSNGSIYLTGDNTSYQISINQTGNVHIDQY